MKECVCTKKKKECNNGNVQRVAEEEDELENGEQRDQDDDDARPYPILALHTLVPRLLSRAQGLKKLKAGEDACHDVSIESDSGQ